MGNLSYMGHITGLRGLAIILVVWFHFTSHNVALNDWCRLPNGYLGVDVFLVIMGYFLMKGFLYKKDLKCTSFVVGKVKRIIFPSAIAIALTLLFAVFLCNYVVKPMASTGLFAILGCSNIWLANITQGYFAADTGNNPLMHTWYIGVAMQIFIICAIGYAVLKRLPGRYIIGVCSVIAICSLIYHYADILKELVMNMGGGEIWEGSVVSYYATLPRLWEILAGGLALFLPPCENEKKRAILFCLGLVAIIIPSCLLAESAKYCTPVVVMGTVLVISYGGGGWSKIVLENRVLAFIGKISFSLYLIHMPLYVLYKIWTFSTPDLYISLVLFVVSLILAYLFFELVEKRNVALKWVLLVIAVGLSFCVAAHKGNKLIAKFLNQPEVEYELPVNNDYRLTDCESLYQGFDRKLLAPYYYWHSLLNNGHGHPEPKTNSSFVWLGDGNPAKAEFVVVGDSHAIHICPGMDKVCKELGMTGVCLNTVIMPLWDRLLPYYGKELYYNAERAQALMNWLEVQDGIKHVVVAIHWDFRFNKICHNWQGKKTDGVPMDENLEGLKEFCARVKKLGKQVVIFYPEPVMGRADITIYAKWLINRGYPMEAEHHAFICTEEEYLKKYSHLIAQLEQLQSEGYLSMLDIRPVLFKNGECKAIRDGVQLFRDENHFTIKASINVADSIKDDFYQIIKGNNEPAL